MKKTIGIILTGLLMVTVMCQPKPKTDTTKAQETKAVSSEKGILLYNKSLPEIKQLINGKWELVSSQNSRESGEYENTFIQFNDDKYIWTEDGKDEPGNLNWRAETTPKGQQIYLMDVFYETNPAYPLELRGDTLFIQDYTETAYKYTLVRK